MKKLLFPVSALVLTHLFSACQNPVQEERPVPGLATSMEISQATYLYPLASPAGYEDIMEWGRLPDGPERERAKQASRNIALPAFQKGVNLLAAFQNEAASTSTRTALVHLERDLATLDEPQRSLAGQLLAIRLLDEYLAGGALDETPPEALARRTLDAEAQAVVAFATEQLTTHNNPNAHLVSATLQTLRTYWPEATIRMHAQKTLAAAEAYLARSACDTCSPVPAHKISKNSLNNQIRAGVEALKPLAQ